MNNKIFILWLICSTFSVATTLSSSKLFEIYQSLETSKPKNITQFLNTQNIDINTTDETHSNLLTYTVLFSENQTLLKQLLDAGINMEQKDSYGLTPLFNTITVSKNFDFAKILLEYKANPSTTNSKGVSILKKSLINNLDSHTILKLIKAGANLNEKIYENSLLSYVLARLQKDIYQKIALALIENGVNITSEDFWKAFKQKQIDIVKTMYKAKFDFKSIKAPSGSLVYDVSIEEISANPNALEVLKIILKAGVDVDTPTTYGNNSTLLLLTHYRGTFYEYIKVLLEAGADINRANNYGYTPLMIAVSRPNNGKIIHLLLENGADINKQNNKKQNAMMIAKKKKHLKNLDVLLQYTAQ